MTLVSGALNGVAGGFGDVLPSRGCGPPDLAAGQLLGRPPRVLLEPVVEPAFGVPVAHTGSAARLVRDVVLEIAVRGRPAAARPGARGVPDLGQVPQQDPGIMALGLMPVITFPGGDRPDLQEQVPLPRDPGGEPPGAVSSGRAGLIGGDEGE